MYHLMSVMMEEDKEIEYRYGEIGLNGWIRTIYQMLNGLQKNQLLRLRRINFTQVLLLLTNYYATDLIDDERKYC